jgi:hypothetical protein
MRVRILQFVLSIMKVRLTRKLAEQIDGIDLAGRAPGDLLDLSPEQARLIVAEQWAIPERRVQETSTATRRRVGDYPSTQTES